MKKCFTPEVKIWKVMKICSIQAMVAMTLCSMAFAHDHYGQVLDKKITISLKDVSLEEALEAIERLTYVKFFYSVDQLGIKDRISVEAVELSLKDLLDELLGPYDVTYKVHERKATITLKRNREEMKSGRSREEGETLAFSPYGAATVMGRVTDAVKDEPMPGVNIIIKGTTEGTTTDSDGHYAISAGDDDVLVFSFIGFKTLETPVGGRTIINVALEEDIKSLDVVEVNAGYWKTTRELQVGNITKIARKEIENQPVSNPLAALQGRVPGLEITQQTGVPGGNFKVRIRGHNSIGNGNDPLYIIDGVPYTGASMAFSVTSNDILPEGTSPLNGINPANIESIEVLKDASATAIYGSRGANGVILITTKKGKAGDTKVDFDFYSGAGKVAAQIDLLNTQQYRQMRKEAILGDGYGAYLENPVFDFIWPDVKTWDSTRYTDWQKELIGGTAYTSDGQLSISGGDKNTQYAFGGGYHEETTVFPGKNSDRRIAAHLSVSNTSLNEKLTTSASVNYSVNASDLIRRDLTALALTLAPNAPPLYNEGGDLNWGPDAWNMSFPNPLAYRETNYESNTDNLLANVLINYSILPNLNLKVSLGYTDIRMKAVTTTPVSFYFPPIQSQRTNNSAFANNSFKNWIIEPQVNWNIKLWKGELDVLVGTSFLNQQSEGLSQSASGFASEALMKNIASASSITLSQNTYTQYRYQAVFGRLNYNLAGRYIIDITGRRDGSSRFGPGKQFADFGAVGVAWIFSKENVIQSALPFLSFGKVRGTYGITGNDQLGDYQYLDTYTSSPGYQGNPGLTPARLSNPDFSWETNTKFETGIDLGFINNRFLLALAYYINRSSNQLVGLSLPPTTGFAGVQSNFPATVENKGMEVELNTQNIESRKFSWYTSINLSVPRNKLIEFPGLQESRQYADRLVIGEPLSIRKTFHYLGVDPQSGLYEFADLNGDGSFNTDDRKTVKFIGPDYFGGVQNTFQYNGFELSFLFQYVKQTGNNYIYSGWSSPGVTNQPGLVMDRWQKPGDRTTIQRFSTTDPAFTRYAYLVNSDRSVGDASFIRLKNISLSYTLPADVLKKIGVSNARLFLRGQNILTITDYLGLDPENQNANSSLPPLRTVVAGIHLSL